jgi:alkylation response protein AidB-like acyl-CoA dehydrogenase
MVMRATGPELVELRQVCQRFLADRHPVTLLDAGVPGQRALWDELVAMGWAATLIPEAMDGMGWGWGEAGVVAEELGRSLAPVPFLSSGLVVPSGLRTITHPLVDAAMTSAARGEARVAVAGLPAQRGSDGAIDVEGGPTGERLRGSCSFVLDAVDTDLFVVVARRLGETVIALADTGPAVDVRRHELLDASRAAASVSFERAPATVVATGAAAEHAIAAMETALAVGLACDSLGGAAHVHAETVEYARHRVQFDRPIGSFQAVKHRLADLYVLLQGTTAIVETAVRQLASADEETTRQPALGSLAHAYAADAYVRIAGDALLVHGAIGFTWEHDLHRYLKRGMLNQQLAGTTSSHRDRHLSMKLAAMGHDR